MVKKLFLDIYGVISHNEKATILHHRKLALKGRLLSERIIWKVPPTIQYPSGFKYRLIVVNPITQEVILLYDNHWPKRPHIHGSKGERDYDFINVEKLRNDFILESVVEVKRYHENKKNSN